MNRIVDNNCTGKREKTVDHYPYYYLPGDHSLPQEPWQYRNCVIDHYRQNGTPVGFISEHERVK